MMKYLKFLVLFLTMGMHQACPGEDDEILAGKLLITNSSDEDVYYYEDFYVKLLNASGVNLDRLKAQRLIVDNVKELKIYQYHFEKNEKLYLFIYKQSTLDNHPWEEIQEQNIYDKLYVLTLNELNTMNWQVVYDGN